MTAFWEEEDPQAKAIREKRMSPMMNQGISPDQYRRAAQDYSAREAELANKRSFAQKNMTAAMDSPNLIRSGNMMVAGANPLSAMAQAIRGGAGAYQSKQADKASGILNADMAESADARGAIALDQDTRKRFEADRTNQLQADILASNQANQKAELEATTAHQGLTRAATAARLGLDQTKREDELAKRDMLSFHSREDPLKPVHFYSDGRGGVTHLDGSPAAPEEWQGLPEWDLDAVGSMGAAKEGAEGEGAFNPEAIRNIARRTTNVFRHNADVIYDGTGLNPAALLGRYNIPGLGEGGKIQDFQRDVKQMKFDSVQRTLKMLDLKPITEGEYKEGSTGSVDTITSPYGLVSATVEDLEVYKGRYDDAIATDPSRAREKEAFVQQMEEEIVHGALIPNPDGGTTFPLTMLTARGVNVQRVRNSLAEKVMNDIATPQEKDFLQRLLQARKAEGIK